MQQTATKLCHSDIPFSTFGNGTISLMTLLFLRGQRQGQQQHHVEHH
jgi:hypothetical protein